MIGRRSLLLTAGASTIAACVCGSLVFAAAVDPDQTADVTDAGHEIWRREGDEHKIDGPILFAISVHETGKRSQPYVTEVGQIFRRLTQECAGKTPAELTAPGQQRSPG